MSIKGIEEYIELRNRLDQKITDIESLHPSEMQCKKGCASCCELISVFPIEFYTILNEQEHNFPKRKFRLPWSKKCPFLENSNCTIYHSRPFICRTQGLPLLYQNLDGTGFEFSTCQLNFTTKTPDFFHINNSLYLTPLNNELFLLNQKFISDNNLKYTPTSRIPMSKLCKK